MKKMNFLRGIALLLAAIMIFTSVPEVAYAAQADGIIEEEVVEPVGNAPAVEGEGDDSQNTDSTDETDIAVNGTTPNAIDEVIVDPVGLVDPATGTDDNLTNREVSIEVVDGAIGYLSGMTYGTELTSPIVLAVTANTVAGSDTLAAGSAYDASAFEWGFYNNNAGTGTPVSLPKGLTAELSANADGVNNIITISGTPVEYIPAGTIYLVVKDKGTAKWKADPAYAQIDISCSAANIAVTTDGTTPLSNINFGNSAKNGYSVTANPSTGDTNYVPPVDLTIVSTQANTEGSVIDDLRAMIVKADPTGKTTAEVKALTASSDYTASFQDEKYSAYPQSNAVLTVKPKEGIKSSNSYGTTGNDYNEYLIVYSDNNRFAPLVYPITFQVGSSLEIKSIKQDGLEAEKDGETSGYTEYTGEVGKAIKPIVITLDENSDLASVTASTYPAGLTGKLNGNVFTISGVPTETASNVEVTITAKDTHGFVAEKYYDDTNGADHDFEISISAPDLAYTFDGEEFTGSAYNWTVSEGYSIADGTKSLVVKNDTTQEVELTVAFQKASDNTDAPANIVMTSSKTISAEKKVKVAAGESLTLTFKPNATGLSANDYTAYLSLSAASIAAKAINLTLTVSGDSARIIKPAGDGDLPDAEINKAYSYVPQVSVKKAWAGYSRTWSITGITPENLKKNYGLTFDEKTGAISGTPFEMATDINIALKCEIKDGSGTIVWDYTKNMELDILPADAGVITVLNADKEELKSAVEYTKQTTTSTNTVTETLYVKNNATVDIAGIEAAVTRVTGPGAVDVSDAAAQAYFTVGGSLNSLEKLSAGGTADFTVYEVESPADKPLAAGTWTVTVTIDGHNLDAPKTATLTLVVTKAPVLTYTAKNGANPFEDSFVKDEELKAETTPTERFVGVTADGETRSMSYSWSPATGSSIPKGLTLDSATGQIVGTPTQAGVYKVYVKGEDSKNGVNASSLLTITVTSPKEVSAINFTQGSATINLLNKEYVFNGVVAGDTTVQKLDLKVLSGTQALTDKLTVTVEDIWGNASTYIKASKPAIANVNSTGRDLTITAQGGEKAGAYLAKVTLDSSEIVPVCFYVYFEVVDPLEINYPEKNGNEVTEDTVRVGTAYKTGIFSVSGGGNTQPIDVSEVLGQNNASYIPAELRLVQNDSTRKNYFTIGGATYNTTGTPTTAKTYTMAFSAKADKLETLTPYYKADDIANTGYVVCPALETEESKSFTITVTPSKGMAVHLVHSTAHNGPTDTIIVGTTPESDANTMDAGDGYYFADKVDDVDPTITHKKNIEGTVSGGLITKLTGYTFESTSPTYSPEEFTISVRNTTGASQVIAAALAGGTASKFTLDTTTPKTVANNDIGGWVVKPNANLPAGTYTDTVSFTCDNAETVTFKISYTVEASSYQVDVEYKDMLSYQYNSGKTDYEAKVIEVLSDGKDKKAGTTPVKIFAKRGTKNSDSNAKITVTNSGNENLKNVIIREVKDAAGTEYDDGEKTKLVINGSAGSGVNYTSAILNKGSALNKTTGYDAYISVNGLESFTASTQPKGAQTAYLKVEFQTGTSTNESDYVIIPVTYVVYTPTESADGSTINPAYTVGGGAHDAESYREADEKGYTASAMSFVATIKNDKESTAATVSNSLYGVEAQLLAQGESWGGTAYTGDELVLSCSGDVFPIDATATTAPRYAYTEIADGQSKTFTVTPKAGLRAGDYEAVLAINAANLATPLEYALKFTVKESAESLANINIDLYEDSEYTTPGSPAVYPAGENNALTQVDAARLYNSLVVGLARNDATSTANIGAEKAIKTVELGNIDGGHADVTVALNVGATIVFDVVATGSGDVDLANVTDVAGAKIAKSKNDSDENVAFTKIETLELDADTKTYLAGESITSYFAKLTLNPYSWVKFTTNDTDTGAVYKVSSKSITKADGTVIADGSNIGADNEVVDAIYVKVAANKTIGSVLSSIPGMVVDGKSFVNYKAGTTAITTSTKVTGDMVAEAQFKDYTLPTPANEKTLAEQAEDGIVWNWAEDGTSVSLTLTCEDGYTITYTGKYGTPVQTTGTENRIAIAQYVSDATCTVGEGYKYTATFDGYTNSKFVGNEEGKLGHKWVYDAGETINYGYGNVTTTGINIKEIKNGEAIVNAEAICSVCGEKKNVYYTVSKKLTKDATCDDDGEYVYLLQAYQLDDEGNTTTKLIDNGKYYLNYNGEYTGQSYQITDFDTEKIPAFGHDFGTELYVEWKTNEKTGEITGINNAYAVCATCGEKVNLTGSTAFKAYTEEKGYAEASAKIQNKTLTAKGYPWLDSDCTFSNPVWIWSEDGSSVVVTLDRTKDKQVTKKTYSTTSVLDANKNGRVVVTTRYAQLNTYYTATLTVSDVNGTTTFYDSYQTATGKGASALGEEDGFMEFGWADGVDWTGEETEHMVYTGAAHKPEVKVTNGSKILVEGTDYTVSYKNNTNAGLATVTIKGKGNYKESAQLVFTIDKKDIGDADVYVGNVGGVAGKKVTPVITYAGKTLGTKDTNASTVFKPVLGASEEFRTISADAVAAKNFKGERDVPVTVVLNKAQLIPIAATVKKGVQFTYDGNEHILNSDITDADCNLVVTTKKGATQLVENEDYTVSYSDNINAGKVKVIITGQGLYTGKISKSFKITPAKTNVLKISNKDELTAVSYRKAGATPRITIEDETLGTDLKEGRDFKVSYSKNKKVGPGTVKVTFIGNYKGHAALSDTFNIVQAHLTADYIDISIQKEFAYDAKKPGAGTYFAKPYVMLDGELLAMNKDYTVQYFQGTTPLEKKTPLTFSGDTAEITAKISVSPKNANYTADGEDPVEITYNVVQSTKTSLAKSKITVVAPNKKGKLVSAKIGYTGEPIVFDSTDEYRQGSIQVKLPGKLGTLTYDQVAELFDVEYINNVKKGTATIILTPNAAGSELYSGSITGTFKIGAGRITGLKW